MLALRPLSPLISADPLSGHACSPPIGLRPVAVRIRDAGRSSIQDIVQEPQVVQIEDLGGPISRPMSSTWAFASPPGGPMAAVARIIARG